MNKGRPNADFLIRLKNSKYVFIRRTSRNIRPHRGRRFPLRARFSGIWGPQPCNRRWWRMLFPCMPPPEAGSYEIAVAEAGCSKYYKLYTADPPAAHANPPMIDAALLHFEELVGHPFGWRVRFIRH